SDGRPRTYAGGYAGYREGNRAEHERWEAEHREQQRERRRLSDELSAAQNRLSTGWRPDKGTGKHTRASRAPALVRAVHRRRAALEAHAVTAPEPRQRFAAPQLPALPGGTLLAAAEVTVRGRLERPQTLALGSADRLVVTGPNGSGKSSLLAVLAGRLEPTTGRVHRARSARVGLLAQESPPPTRRRAVDLYDAAIGRLVSAGRLAEDEVVPLGGRVVGRPAAPPRPRPAAGRPAARRPARRADEPPVDLARRRADRVGAGHGGRRRDRHPRPAAAARHRGLAPARALTVSWPRAAAGARGPGTWSRRPRRRPRGRRRSRPT